MKLRFWTRDDSRHEAFIEDRGEARFVTKAAPKAGEDEDNIVWGLFAPFEVRHDADE
jgi:hypothetical protein